MTNPQSSCCTPSPHVAVLWLVNEKNELLMAQRAHHKRQDPSVWGPSVTGKLEPGESASDALLRETREELSLGPSTYKPRFLFKIPFDHPDGEQRIFHVYTARVAADIINAIVFDANEVAAIKWLGITDAKALLLDKPGELVPSARAVWPETFEKLENT